MRWKSNVHIIKGVPVSPGNEVTDSDKAKPRLKRIIEIRDSNFIMTDEEETAYLAQVEKALRETKKYNKEKHKEAATATVETTGGDE